MALAEVADGKCVANAAQEDAEVVDPGMVKATGAGGKEAGVHFGLGKEVSVFRLLMLHGFDEGAKGFVGLTRVELFDTEVVAGGTYEIDWDVGISNVLDGRTGAGKVPIDEMVLAFGQLQGSAAGPKEIVP